MILREKQSLTELITPDQLAQEKTAVNQKTNTVEMPSNDNMDLQKLLNASQKTIDEYSSLFKGLTEEDNKVLSKDIQTLNKAKQDLDKALQTKTASLIKDKTIALGNANEVFKSVLADRNSDKDERDKSKNFNNDYAKEWEDAKKSYNKSKEIKVLHAWYKEAFPNIPAKQLDDLGIALIYEAEDLGFDESMNPFITYLNTYYKMNGKLMNKAGYDVIHNSFADGHYGGGLDKNDLLGKGLIENNTILYRSSLFDKSTAEIKYLIDILGNRLSNMSQIAQYITKPEVIMQYSGDRQPEKAKWRDDKDAGFSFLTDLFYEDSDIRNKIFHKSQAAKIVHSARFVSATLVYCDTKNKLADTSLKEWGSNWKNIGINKNNYKKALAIITFNFTPSAQDQKTIADKYKLETTIDSQDPEIVTLKNKLKTLDINAHNYLNVVDTIYNSFNSATKAV